MARWWRIAGACLFLFFLQACYSMTKPPPPPSQPPLVDQGIASWYGPGFHGKRTSSGAVFDQEQMTAAHPTLPLGSRVLVTNEQNGRRVEVVINDRGPFVPGRVIDLSRAAAGRLDMLESGTTQVRLRLLSPPPDGSHRVRYAVQVGAFVQAERAHTLMAALDERFGDTYLSQRKAGNITYFRVRLGPYGTKNQAEERAKRLVTLGWPVVVVEENAK